MRTLLALLVLVSLALLPGGSVLAQSSLQGSTCGYSGGFLEPVAGFQTAVSVSTVVVKPTIPAGTKVMVVQVEANDIRYTDDGTTVSSTVGVIVRKNAAGEPGQVVVCRPNQNFQMIRASADATVNISYYGVNQRNQ